MEVLSRKTFMETGKSLPRLFMSAEQLSEYEGKSSTHYRHSIHESEEQVRLGRYPKTSVGNGKPMDVNYLVYRDYITNRNRLKSRTLKKTVEPFNPAEIAAMCPIVREVIVMGGDE